jgi:hypothetical protein
MSALDELRKLLIAGIKLSMQSSYERRAPAQNALPLFLQARVGLRQFVQDHPQSEEAWRLLSQAEECLLKYSDAINCLRQALLISGKRSKSDLKRLALLQQAMEQWSTLPLSPNELHELGDYLVQQGTNKDFQCRSMRLTKQWLNEKGFSNIDGILQELGNRGAYTDFQVLYNVVRG